MAKIVQIKDEEIVFNTGHRITYEHDQDCCEHHWLEFDDLRRCNIGTATGKTIDIYQQEFSFPYGEINFKKVDGLGVLLYDNEGNKYLITGHGTNNGYYSTNIRLCLYKGVMLVKKYDVSKCQNIEEE